MGVCGWKTGEMVKGILIGDTARFADGFKYSRWCFGGVPLVGKLDKMLDGKTYLVALQNNNELRASGGFMGSYARLKFEKGVLKNVEVQDIYQPDGQLVGHVNPPAPIQKAFGQGWWKLRDSNWDADFSVAGEQMAWFFEQGGERADGIVAVNLGFINKWLEELGEVKTVTYDERVTAKNLASLAQTYSEVNREKRDFLGAVGAALWERTKAINLIDLIHLIDLIYQELQKRQILMWMADKDIEKEIVKLGWGGDLGSYTGDYLYVVEANLGVNKANCCVTRSVIQTVDGEKEKVTIKWENSSEFADPKPPVFWGGDYTAYVRVVVPAAAVIQEVEKYDVETRGKFKIVGFWVGVPAGGEATAELEYSVLRQAQDRFTILVKRQPGIESFPYKLVVEGKVVVSDTIDRDKEYSWTK